MTEHQSATIQLVMKFATRSGEETSIGVSSASLFSTYL